MQLVQDLLKSLPQMFGKTMETQCALGPALQAAFKLLSATGGRVSVFQTQLPSLGVGALKSREDPNQRASAKVETRETGSHWFIYVLHLKLHPICPVRREYCAICDASTFLVVCMPVVQWWLRHDNFNPKDWVSEMCSV